MIGDLAVFAVLVGVILVIGLGIGLLAARPLARWAERDEEEPNGDD